MEHADTAQLAALGGALGSVLVLLGRGRLPLLAGLVVLGAAELGLAWALGGGPLDRLSGASGAAAVALALVALGAATALFVKRPAIVPDRRARGRAAAAAAVVRQLEHAARADRRRRAARQAPAALLRARRGGRRAGVAGAARPRAAPAADAGGAPGRGVLRLRVLLAALGGRRGGRHEPAAVLHAAVRGAARHGGARELPALGAARAGRRRARARHAVRGGGPLAGGHPRAVLLRAEPRRVEREHGLLPRDLAVRRPEPLRPPRGARDRRGAHAARHAALACRGR